MLLKARIPILVKLLFTLGNCQIIIVVTGNLHIKKIGSFSSFHCF